MSPPSLCLPAWSYGTPIGELQVLEGLGRDEVQESASSTSVLTGSQDPPLIHHPKQGRTAIAAPAVDQLEISAPSRVINPPPPQEKNSPGNMGPH